MQLQKRKVSELKNAHYNPSGRTDDKKIRKLKESIEEYGLIIPIIVTKSGQVIEGHRRLAACKQLGWDEVPVIVIDTPVPAELFASLNSTTRRLNGNEALQVYLKQPNALTEKLQWIHQDAESVLGREMLQKMAKQGTSITMYRWAKQIGNYVSDTRPEFLRKACKWMMKHRCTKVIIGLTSLGHSPALIRKAVLADKPIKATYDTTI